VTGIKATIPVDKLSTGSYILLIGEEKPIRFEKM
jgi:hypothetical protein